MAERDFSTINVGILTVSDSCYNGVATDRSGESLKYLVESGKLIKGSVVTKDIIPDEFDQIKEKLLHWSDYLKLDLILTSGGTGFTSRDVTPEATKAVLEKEALGLTIAMLKGSLDITPMAMLSRLVCGSRGGTLIINLPGSPKGSAECFQIVSVCIPHAVDLLRGHKSSVEKIHSSLQAEGAKLSPHHSHSQFLHTKSDRNISQWLNPGCSMPPVSMDIAGPSTSCNSLASSIKSATVLTGSDQNAALPTLIWRMFSTLPRETRLSLMNSFSSPLSSEQIQAAASYNVHLTGPNVHHVLGQPTAQGQHELVDKIVHDGGFSQRQHTILSHPSAGATNIQIVRPQINANSSASQSINVLSQESLNNSSVVTHSDVSAVPFPSLLSSDLSPVNSPQSSIRMNQLVGVSPMLCSTQLQEKNNSIKSTCLSNQRDIAGANSQHSAHLTDGLRGYEGHHKPSTSSRVGNIKPLHLEVKSLHNFDNMNVVTQSDTISAREIKVPIHSSVNPIVQVFLPCYKHFKQQPSNARQKLHMNETQGSPISVNFDNSSEVSDLSDDVDIGVDDNEASTLDHITTSGQLLMLNEDERDKYECNTELFNDIGDNINIYEHQVLSTSNFNINKTCKSTQISVSCTPETNLINQSAVNLSTQSSEYMVSSIKSAKIHSLKTKGELIFVPVGTSLKSFINQHPLIQGIYLHKGKREIKKQLAQLCRQIEASSRMTSWRRGKEILERNQFDDYFELTEEGRREQMEVLAARKRDQYVVNWYVWCPGHSNCKRKCGGYGVCIEKCKGMMHKQDRHNCSLMINMKLFLSDLSTWRINITGSHVPPSSEVTWMPPYAQNVQCSSSHKKKTEAGCKETVRSSTKTILCRKLSSQGNSGSVEVLPLADVAPVKQSKVSPSTAKTSVVIPTKKRISKMLSNLKRRRLERQSTQKTSSTRKEENATCSDVASKRHWLERNVTSDSAVVQYGGKHWHLTSNDSSVPASLINLIDSFSDGLNDGSSHEKIGHEAMECQKPVSTLPSVTTVMSHTDAVTACSPDRTVGHGRSYCPHSHRLLNMSGDLDQPYLNSNTLSEILQQANGQKIFNNDSELASTSSSSNLFISEQSDKIEHTMTSNFCSDLIKDQSGIDKCGHTMTVALSSPSTSMFETFMSQVHSKSKSEAIASIVQSLCWPTDYHSLLNQEGKIDTASSELMSDATLLEELPSYQEAAASLTLQFDDAQHSDYI